MIKFFKNLFRYNIVKLLLLVFVVIFLGYIIFTWVQVGE